jgi:hypothetical protein
MSEQPDFLRRERVTDAVLEFERRIRERSLAIDHSECWDVLLNRTPARPAADPLPLRYETRAEISLLRVIELASENLACPACNLFGRSHCCGGLVFLYYALRDAGEQRPLEWLGVEIEPGIWLPDWELMAENAYWITRRLRDYFEARLDRVSADPGD